MGLPITKLSFMKRAYDKCSKPISSITDNSEIALQVENVYEPALHMVIEDTGGVEFEGLYIPGLAIDKRANNGSISDMPFPNYNVFNKSPDIIKLLDKRDKAYPLGTLPGVTGSVPYFEEAYYPGDDALVRGDYILSSLDPPNLRIIALWFKSDLNLWNPKAIECAVTYCAFLLAPNVGVVPDRQDRLLNEYRMLIDEYNVRAPKPSVSLNTAGSSTIVSEGIIDPALDELDNLPFG